MTATLRRHDVSTTVRAAFLAGCDGAHSVVRKAARIAFAGQTPGQTYHVADAYVTGKLGEHELAVRLNATNYLLWVPLPEQGRYRIFGQLPERA